MVVRQHVKARMAIPQAIAGAPRLREDLQWIWDAFSDLTTERAPGGFGPPGHIPWRAVRDYAREFGIRGVAFLHFKEVVKEMDDALLAHIAKEMAKKTEGSGDGGTS